MMQVDHNDDSGCMFSREFTDLCVSRTSACVGVLEDISGNLSERFGTFKARITKREGGNS